ncbi:hypothetical protein ACFV30_29140 [Streptomyces sp. NPDC059752]|uniref:hypothetical protein n=1 Tax=unclassified Streptomyces TaxID=2593676 RepID=UPI00364F5A51
MLTRAAVITGTALAMSLPASQALARPAYEGPGTYTVPPEVRAAVRRAQERNKRVLTGIPSKNGWEMENVADDGGSIHTRPVPGTPFAGVAVRMGEVEAVLVHVVRRFHYEIDALHQGEVVGWRKPGKVRKGLPEGNQASGTAVQIRPGHYPPGVRGGFFPHEEIVVRDILAELEGVVRWGGDDRKPDESLFYVDVKPGDQRLKQVAAKLWGWRDEPGAGAGTAVDVLAGERRGEARKLAMSQQAGV